MRVWFMPDMLGTLKDAGIRYSKSRNGTLYIEVDDHGHEPIDPRILKCACKATVFYEGHGRQRKQGKYIIDDSLATVESFTPMLSHMRPFQEIKISAPNPDTARKILHDILGGKIKPTEDWE